MRAAKTHFEQISVEIVKKIAKELPESGLGHPQERWKKIAKQVQQEHDPIRLTELVAQLLKEFDERNATKRGNCD